MGVFGDRSGWESLQHLKDVSLWPRLVREEMVTAVEACGKELLLTGSYEQELLPGIPSVTIHLSLASQYLAKLSLWPRSIQDLGS